MSKELEVLQKMRRQLNEPNRYDFHIELDLFETALKKKEKARKEIDHLIEITTDFNVRMYLVAIRKVLL